MISITALFALFVLSLLTWSVYIVISRLFLSPLAKFPGPKLAALTLWYQFYFNEIKGGQFMWEIERMHEKYGPIVRINPYEVHINDHEFYDELYAGAAKRDKWIWFVAGAGSPLSTFETISHDHHRLRRNAINHFFSKRTITLMEPVIVENVNNLCHLFHDKLITKKPVNLHSTFSALTLDIISDYCFGAAWGCIKNPEHGDELSANIRDAFEMATVIMQFPWLLKVMAWVPDSMVPGVILHHRLTRKQVQRVLDEPVEKKPERNTIFYELRDSTVLPPHEKTLSRLADEGNVLIGAGSETTANVLSIASYHLLANPEVLEILLQELDRVMPKPDDDVTWTQLEQLPYLVGVINESLRISSPITTRLPRISPLDDIEYRGWKIPAGTPISMSYAFIHHSPTLFPEPFKFKPSRWLPDAPINEALNGSPITRYLVPFAKGSRNCVGLNLASAELYLTIGRIFRKFSFELHDTDYERDVKTKRDHFVGASSPESTGIRIVVAGLRS